MLFVILILILFIWLFYRICKVPKIGAVALFTGAPKAGKSTCAVWFAIFNLRLNRFKVKVINFFRKLFHSNKPQIPRPEIYSNIPLNMDYIPLTRDLILRKKRFEYGCVIYLGESSLVADSFEYRDSLTNEELQLFCKLIGHETKGGCLIMDTQCIADNHFAFKRVTSQYFYVHHLVKIPFFVLAYVLEKTYSEDCSDVQVNSSDVEDNLKIILIPKLVWKMFDPYCYSVLTDELCVDKNLVNGKKLPDLKARDIVSFKTWRVLDIKKFINQEVFNEKKNS